MIQRRAWMTGVATLLMVGPLLGACASKGPDNRFVSSPQPVTALVFQLGAIEIADETGPNAAGSVAVEGFSTPPQQALLDWAAAHLQADGGQPGIVRFRATEAKAERVELERTPGVSGWFTRDQADRVVLTLGGHIEARGSDGRLIASATARTEAHRSFVEKISPADRRRGLDLLMKDALQSFGDQLESQVRAEMPNLLR